MIKCNIVYLDMGDEFHLHGVRTLTKKKTIFYLKKTSFQKSIFSKLTGNRVRFASLLKFNVKYILNIETTKIDFRFQAEFT